jgi:hypothetical protein
MCSGSTDVQPPQLESGFFVFYGFKKGLDDVAAEYRPAFIFALKMMFFGTLDNGNFFRYIKVHRNVEISH